MEFSKTKIPTIYGELYFWCFKFDDQEVYVITNKLRLTNPVNLRLHSACFTSEIFGSLKCDCKNQLNKFLNQMKSKDSYMLVYFPSHEGRGIGFFNKLKVYEVQRKLNLDTYEANKFLGFPIDKRDFSLTIPILKHFKVKDIILYTNNPYKISFIKKLKEAGFKILKRKEIISFNGSSYCLNYLLTKIKKGNHLIDERIFKEKFLNEEI